MASYPPPTRQNAIYNSLGFVTADDINGSQRLTLDLSEYVRRNSGIFSANIEAPGLVLSNETQNKAFTDAKNTTLEVTANKCTDIAYSSNQTTISGDFAVTGNVIFPDNALTTSKISGLQTKLNNIKQVRKKIRFSKINIVKASNCADCSVV